MKKAALKNTTYSVHFTPCCCHKILNFTVKEAACTLPQNRRIPSVCLGGEIKAGPKAAGPLLPSSECWLSLPSACCSPPPACGNLDDPLRTSSDTPTFWILDPVELATIITHHVPVFLFKYQLSSMCQFKLKCMCDVVRDAQTLKCLQLPQLLLIKCGIFEFKSSKFKQS